MPTFKDKFGVRSLWALLGITLSATINYLGSDVIFYGEMENKIFYSFISAAVLLILIFMLINKMIALPWITYVLLCIFIGYISSVTSYFVTAFVFYPLESVVNSLNLAYFPVLFFGVLIVTGGWISGGLLGIFVRLKIID